MNIFYSIIDLNPLLLLLILFIIVDGIKRLGKKPGKLR